MVATRRQQGFTLIELMIVVAIIGILAAVAIPNFIRFQLRSKAGEAKLNLAAIRIAQNGYFGENGSFIDIALEPSTTGGIAIATTRRAWDPCPDPIAMTSPGHCIVGYAPEGPTFFDYGVATNGPGNGSLGPGATATEFWADAASDLDGDGTNNLWGLRVPPQTTPQAMDTTAAGPNGCDEVVDDYGADNLYSSIGPCEAGHGTFVF